MPLPVIANVARVSIEGKTPNGTSWVNVLHFHFVGGGGPLPTDESALITKLVHLYSGAAYVGGANLMSFCSNSLTLTEMTILELDGVSASRSFPQSIVGSGGATDQLPAQTSAVVKFKTGFRGRSNRGRVYLPPFLESKSDLGGHISLTDRGLILAQFAGFGADVATAQWNHVVASYIGAGAQHLVIDYDMDVYYKVQRRRRV
jgi:hypothetical protein